MLESKMHHIQQQYEHLLLDQLDQQRAFYEEQLAIMESQGAAASQDLARALEEANASASAAVASHKEAVTKLSSVERRLV